MSGTIDSSQRWYGELGTVELVEPGSAVVDERRIYPAPPRPFGAVHAGDVWQFRDTPRTIMVSTHNLLEFRDTLPAEERSRLEEERVG
jgi:hypothetical protein